MSSKRRLKMKIQNPNLTSGDTNGIRHPIFTLTQINEMAVVAREKGVSASSLIKAEQKRQAKLREADDGSK